MEIILCHTTADFDALGAAVGLARLHPGSKIVLTGGAHPTVREFLALYRDEYPLIDLRAVTLEAIRSISIVDAQKRDRLGVAAAWLDLPNINEIFVCDHHLGQDSDIPATERQIDSVGATTTLIVERLQRSGVELTPTEATVMALGIHVDTGSLTFEMTTARDALALAWLMQQGANLAAIAEYVEPGLSPQLQQLLPIALQQLQERTVNGSKIGWIVLETDRFVPGLSSLVSQIRTAKSDLDAIVLIHACADRDRKDRGVADSGYDSSIVQSPKPSVGAIHELPLPMVSSFNSATPKNRVSIVARSSHPHVDLGEILQPFHGGGHAQAAAASLRGVEVDRIATQLVEAIAAAMPQPPTARDLMSAPARTIPPETTIAQAQRLLLRYGHSGLPIVDAAGELVGIISRRDLDIARHHGFAHAPVKGYMTKQVRTIELDTTLPEIERLMVTGDLGRLPVLAEGKLVGIVTRTDVLRELQHRDRGVKHRPIAMPPAKTHIDPYQEQGFKASPCQGENTISPTSSILTPSGAGDNYQLSIINYQLNEQLQHRFAPQQWQLLTTAANIAERSGWQLYLVGGAVRDLLLAGETSERLLIKDIDLVVDGGEQIARSGAGVELATALQDIYPAARLDVHGAFQTAALLWHQDREFDSMWVDIATARTEFYPYPAANPEVEASSIRQDLYRRDFTINAMALRLTSARVGDRWRSLSCGDSPLLDFFGGLADLEHRQIRVLHPNSFIEDPTRIYRGARFAARLGFHLEARTVEYIRYAIASGVYDRTVRENAKTPALQTRLKAELKQLLSAPYWRSALKLLADLDALQCIHPTLALTPALWWQLQFVDRCWHRFNPPPTLDSPQATLRERWQLLLELTIASLAPTARAQVARNLQLPADSIDRLQDLATTESAILACLSQCQRPSEIVHLFQQHDLPTLIAIGTRNSRAIRRQIWQYLTVWSQVRAPLTGKDLQRLGYKPGAQYRHILDRLLDATLDGEITDRASAEAFLQPYCPDRSV